MDINDIQLLGLSITTLSVSFAIFTYKKNKLEQKSQLLKVLLNQLHIAGPWVSSNSNGYTTYSDNLKLNNANPFKLIYKIENNPLTNIGLLPEISSVPEEIIGKINEFNQDVVKISNIQRFKSQLVTQNYDLSKSIKIKLDNYISENPNRCYCDFHKLLNNDEKFFVNRLVSYGRIIHIDIIGNKSKAMRLHWEPIDLLQQHLLFC